MKNNKLKKWLVAAAAAAAAVLATGVLDTTETQLDNQVIAGVVALLTVFGYGPAKGAVAKVKKVRDGPGKQQ